MKKFNTTGTCFPAKHYMVDISERIRIISGMIDDGDYFCINRGRQYGKTTTLAALKEDLEHQGYAVLSISFEMLGEEAFNSDSSLSYWFVWLINRAIIKDQVNGIDSELAKKISDVVNGAQSLPLPICSDLIVNLCERNSRKIVLMIDEVDQASNYASFIKLLGMLRALYLDREAFPTFQSVILAGVYDIKNLKLKMRSEGEHQYNSPWNIAAPFDVDMSLHAEGIAGMLNLRHLMERFAEHFNDIYGSQPDAFKEKEGRRLFLLYLRPVINGTGNYYVEAETRDETRTDIVIDYLGHQYVIELKIWRGNAYNERGEQQLSEYLDYFHLQEGYMVSFCFNKNKTDGVRDVTLDGRKIVEAVV